MRRGEQQVHQACHCSSPPLTVDSGEPAGDDRIGLASDRLNTATPNALDRRAVDTEVVPLAERVGYSVR